VTGALPSDRVVIAVDPHKASWTAAALGSSLQPLDVIRVRVSWEGYRQLRRFARRWSNPGWAIEGAAGLGAPLTQRLNADAVGVTDVPAKLAARVRVLSTGHGRETDEADATLPLAEIVYRLNALQPPMLGGYASMLALPVLEARVGRLRIASAQVSSTSETLLP
jgi:hypothetical protein